jgi:hypothetical protein
MVCPVREYGLVDPGETIDPYDETLAGMPEEDRCRWSIHILSELEARVGDISGIRSSAMPEPRTSITGSQPACRLAGRTSLDPSRDSGWAANSPSTPVRVIDRWINRQPYLPDQTS